MVAGMLLTMLTYRMPNQRAMTVVNAWTVQGGSREVVRVAWDPAGRMTADEAAEASLRLALNALESQRARRGSHARRDDARPLEGQLTLVSDPPEPDVRE